MSDRTPANVKIARELRHELRTPLHQILGYVQMLQEDLRSIGQSRAVEDLQKVERAAQRLVSLIDKVVASEAPGRVSGDPIAVPQPIEVVSRQGDSKATLLVVDDEELNRDMLGRRLAQRGYRVVTAAGGREAIAAVRASLPDLILLDVMMPEVSGLDVLRELRGTYKTDVLPIIMATARDNSDDVVEALRAGANDYVTKPIDFAVALARLELHLSLKRASQQVRDLNRQLQQSQERIAELIATSAQAIDDVSGWSRRMADEIRAATGASEVSVWILNEGDLQPATDTTTPPPDVSQFASRPDRIIYENGGVIMPVNGLTGTIYGVVMLAGKPVRLTDLEERLVLSFVHQLGGALEVRHTRELLSEAQEANSQNRQALIDSGIDLVSVCSSCGACYDQTSQRCPADDMPVANPNRLLPYRIGGRYRLVRLLGQGGMGTVFESFDERLSRSVAIKVINPEHFHVPMVRLRFEREAHALARVAHPGVIALYDSGELPDGAAFLVMELLQGCDLRQLLQKRGRATPAQASRFLRLASSALAAAHRAGVIHRDVKPPNVFITGAFPNFQIKIVDFGIAKPLDLQTHLTESGMLVGTPAYMAPEQLMGNNVDARADVYALAAVAFESLTGEPLTQKTDFASIILDVIHKRPPRLSDLLRGVPSEVDAAFEAGLATSPDDRPKDIEEWVESFASILEKLPTDTDGWAGDLVGFGKRGATEAPTTVKGSLGAKSGHSTIPLPEDTPTARG